MYQTMKLFFAPKMSFKKKILILLSMEITHVGIFFLLIILYIYVYIYSLISSLSEKSFFTKVFVLLSCSVGSFFRLHFVNVCAM